MRSQSETQRAALEAFIRKVLEAEDQVLALAGAGAQIAPGLESGVLVADRLAERLRQAASEMERFGRSADARLDEARLRLQHRGDPAALARALSLQRSDREIAPVEQGYVAGGLTAEEARARTRGLRETAEAAAEAAAETARLGAQLRAAGSAERAGSRAAARAAARLRREMEKARQEARKLETALARTLGTYARDAIESRDEVAQAWGAGFKGLEDALTRFVTTGKASFGDLANSIIADLARIAIRQNITGPLADALGGVFGSGAAPRSSPRPRARPFHDGGVPKVERNPAPVAFAPALKPGEVHTVLMEGEAVLTSAQSRALLAGRADSPDQARAQAILREAARYHAGGVAGVPGVPGLRGHDIPSLRLPGRSGSEASGAGPGPRVDISIDNRGTAQRAVEAHASFSPDRWVIGLVVEDILTNGPIGQAVRTTTGESPY
ncbi:phage tail tape measure C-terminal domain-containing protein [Ruegeria sp.]|uniref:phage tail tape measure C-terminal domain-containing protein n=3 Tax=Ruegeria sp. TaxID=1879320 RepID=UPI003B00E08B